MFLNKDCISFQMSSKELAVEEVSQTPGVPLPLSKNGALF